MPWRIATGVSMVLWALALLLVGGRMEYLSSYLGLIVHEYGVTLAAHLTVAAGALFAGLYWLARRAGLGDVGGKLRLMDKRLTAGEAHDAELGRRLDRERGGDLG